MAEIKLYQFWPIADRESASPFCVKLHYALRYKRLQFETVNLASPTQAKKYNPRGKLPVLDYDGTLIRDSTDAVRYLEQHNPEPRLYPENERERAHALLLEDWADESLYWHIVYENWLIGDQFEKFAAEILASMPASASIRTRESASRPAISAAISASSTSTTALRTRTCFLFR